MTYLFWSFAVVWIALFAYVRLLMRRTRALEDEVRRLSGDLQPDTPRTAQPAEDRQASLGAGSQPADPRPVRREATSPASRGTP
jgi:CcmD family protein